MQDKLKRDISTSAILICSAGSMIGSGWLFSPLYASQIAGPGALISWFLASLFMLFIALPLCELGTIYPISGGMSNYPKFTHGAAVGFIYSWVAWLSYVVMTPIEVQAVLQYASVYFPSIIHKNNGLVELTATGYGFALIIMFITVLINTFGIKLLAESNKILSIVKFCVPLLTVGAFFYCAKSFDNLKGFDLTAPVSWHNIFSAMALGGIAFAFAGFQNGLVLAGEVKNPQRNIPISILGAIFIGFVLYFLLQLSFIIALPQELLKDGFAKLTFAGDSGPLVGLGMILGLGLIVKLLLLDSMISPMGTALVYTTATSRILYGMAENGYLPKQFLKLNKSKIPVLTLVVNFLFGMLAFLPFPNWQKMVAFLSSTSILTYGIGPICLLALRKQQPNIERPFRLSFHGFICQVAFFACNLMLYWCGWDIIWKLYLAILFGAIIFVVYYKQHKVFSLLRNDIWFVAYIHGLLLISFCGNFGGGQDIFPKFFDFLSLAVLSVGILTWSKFNFSKTEVPFDKTVAIE